MAIKTPTLADLRKLARERGIRGFSKMNKAELEARLATPEARPESSESRRGAPEAKSAAGAAAGTATKPTASPAPKTAPKPIQPNGRSVQAQPEPETELVARVQQPESTEEQIESAKFDTAPPMMAHHFSTERTELGEDIERLPEIQNARVCVLPQKPGVVHVYWTLPAIGDAASRSDHLRLVMGDSAHAAVIAEVTLSARKGHWYFHVPAPWPISGARAQVGFYRNGDFVAAFEGGQAVVPATQGVDLDPRWAIAATRFREMYLRAGGVEEKGALHWHATAGSPHGGVPTGAGESPSVLRWPGAPGSR